MTKSTNAILNGLTNGTRCFVVVTATNTSNVTSPNSIQRDEMPTFVEGFEGAASHRQPDLWLESGATWCFRGER